RIVPPVTGVDGDPPPCQERLLQKDGSAAPGLHNPEGDVEAQVRDDAHSLRVELGGAQAEHGPGIKVLLDLARGQLQSLEIDRDPVWLIEADDRDILSR